MIGDTNYDENLNVFGQPMAPAPQVLYEQGQEIEVDVILTAYHKGHFEFHACPIEAEQGTGTGTAASGDCLNEYLLKFVSDPFSMVSPRTSTILIMLTLLLLVRP